MNINDYRKVMDYISPNNELKERIVVVVVEHILNFILQECNELTDMDLRKR